MHNFFTNNIITQPNRIYVYKSILNPLKYITVPVYSFTNKKYKTINKRTQV